MKYYRLNFSLNDADGFAPSDTLIEVTKSYTPAEEPQFNAEAVAEYAKSKKDEGKKPEDDDDDKGGEEEKCPKCGKKKSECECDDDDDSDDEDEKKKKQGKKEKYNLEEIQEYVELSNNYSALEANYSAAQTRISELEGQLAELTTFKKSIEKAEKEKMIASFYMLSDEDKKDVIENIDNYSLNDIEAKLSILCVRNKVSFNLDDNKDEGKDPMTFSLNGGMADEAPAWVKALRSVASEM
jgi:DNA-binding transcriptional MerR regulator